MARKKKRKPSRTLTGIYGSAPKRRKIKKKAKAKSTTGIISKKNVRTAKKFLSRIQKEAHGFDMTRM